MPSDAQREREFGVGCATQPSPARRVPASHELPHEGVLRGGPATLWGDVGPLLAWLSFMGFCDAQTASAGAASERICVTRLSKSL